MAATARRRARRATGAQLARCGRAPPRAARGRAARRRAGDAPAVHDDPRLARRTSSVDRVTLLVIPAPQLHPFPARSPELAYWLLDRQRRRGRDRPARAPAPADAARRRCSRGPCGAGRAARPPSTRGWTRRTPRRSRSTAGRRVLRARGAARARLRRSRLRLHRRAARASWRALRLVGDAAHASTRAPRTRSPALCLGTSSPLKRADLAARGARGRGAVRPRLLRLDLHPADFDHPRHVAAVERVLRARAGPRGGDLRRPLLSRSVLRANWREGDAPRRDTLRLHLPVAAALSAPVVLGLVLPRDRVVAHRPRTRPARSCAR